MVRFFKKKVCQNQKLLDNMAKLQNKNDKRKIINTNNNKYDKRTIRNKPSSAKVTAR